MSRKKKGPSEQKETPDWTEAHYMQAMSRVLESVDQLQRKEGPIFEKWKAGMKAYLESLEEEGK